MKRLACAVVVIAAGAGLLGIHPLDTLPAALAEIGVLAVVLALG